MTKLAKILSLIAICLIQSAYAANVFYVTPDGTGSGTSWSDATTLSDAYSKVVAGDTIRMKADTYTMTARVQVTKAITIEGGYKAEVDGHYIEWHKLFSSSCLYAFLSSWIF